MPGVFITVFDGAELGSVDSDHPDVPPTLVVRKQYDFVRGVPRFTSVDLGLFTKKNITALQEYLERLKIHAE